MNFFKVVYYQLLPFVNFGIEFYFIKDILKTIIVSSLKHGQLVEDHEEIAGANLKKIFFLSYCPLQIAFKTFNKDISKIIIAGASNLVS